MKCSKCKRLVDFEEYYVISKYEGDYAAEDFGHFAEVKQVMCVECYLKLLKIFFGIKK